jgi:hypothetical protein
MVTDFPIQGILDHLVKRIVGKAIAVPDLARDDRYRWFTPQAIAAGLAAVFTFPLTMRT